MRKVKAIYSELAMEGESAPSLAFWQQLKGSRSKEAL